MRLLVTVLGIAVAFIAVVALVMVAGAFGLVEP